MSKPTEDGKKYIQLTQNILLEYVYVKDRYDQVTYTDIDNDILGYDTNSVELYNLIDYGTYGRASNSVYKNTNKYIIARNDYTQEQYFMNDMGSHDYTHNSMMNSVLPVKKDSSQWVRMTDVNGEYYSKYDRKWCVNLDTSEYDLLLNPDNAEAEYIPYDIIRIYFQSGYHSDYDGFIFNFYTKDYDNKYINLLSVLHENGDNVRMVKEPMWFADKIYTTYIEYRIPSTAYLSSDCIGGPTNSMQVNNWTDYDRKHPYDKTLPAYLTNNKGFYSNPAIGVDLHAVVGKTRKHSFDILKTQTLVSTLFPNRDAYDKLFAKVRPSSDGDYYEIYGYYENDPSNPVYDSHSLYEYLNKFNGTFTIAHIITVTENWTNSENEVQSQVQAPLTYLQTWDSLEEMEENMTSPVIKFRPVLEHTADMVGENDGAVINYTLRIISNRDNTSIIKTSSTAIIRPRRFGYNYSVATLYAVNDIHVYNRIEQTPALNVSTVTTPISGNNNSAVQVNRYVTSSFIDRRNIRVSISPVKIENIES